MRNPLKRVEWGGALAAWLADMASEGASPATIRKRVELLDGSRCRDFRGARGIRGPGDIRRETLEDLRRSLMQANLKPQTVRTHLSAWKGLAVYSAAHGWLSPDVAADISRTKMPKVPHSLPTVISPAEEAALLIACHSLRDRFLVRFILETGLRRSEVARVTVDDIGDGGALSIIRVREGKGGKDRGVPITEEFRDELQHYLEHIRPRWVSTRALFVQCGNRNRGMSPQSIYRVFWEAARHAGVQAWPHKGRHTAATRWIAEGVPGFAVKEALGHTTMAMTQKYVHLAMPDVVDAFQRRHRRHA